MASPQEARTRQHRPLPSARTAALPCLFSYSLCMQHQVTRCASSMAIDST
jgi:hypothetical protein